MAMMDFDQLADKDLELVDSEGEDNALPLSRLKLGGLGLADAGGAAAAALPKPIHRRMQVLVLHGRQSNENLVAFQLSGLKGALGKEVDIHILEGDLVWHYREGFDNHDADPMTLSLAKGRDFKLWFTHEADDPRDRVDFFKQQDPNVKVTYSGSEAAVDKLLKFVETQPVDVIVGIFEGSIVAHLAIGRLVQAGKPIPWRMSLFLGSMCIRDDNLAGPFLKTRVDHPTVHVFGKTDEWMYYQRTAAGRKPPEDYYKNPLVFEHPGGHALPQGADPVGRHIYERSVAEMRYQCGLLRSPPPKVANAPKPTSMLLKNLEDMSPRKVRILALCGGHSCAKVIKFQTNMLKAALGKEAEWTYIDGTNDWNYYAGEPIVSEGEKMIAGNTQLKNWYMDTCHEEGGKKTDRLNRDKQFDPTTWVEFKEVPENVKKLRDYIWENGPFDVVVGFSQGCIMLHLLIGFLRKEAPAGRETHPERWKHAIHDSDQMPWRCTLFFSGMHIRDKRYFDLFDQKSPHPTLHVFGKEDEYYDYARTGFNYRPQEEYYENPIILCHEQSHEFPTAQPRARQIYDKVSAFVWRHCGGEASQ